MKRRGLYFCFLAILSILLMPIGAFAATFTFKKVEGISIKVLTPQAFEATFGDNPDIPLTHDAIVQYAKELYPPLDKRWAMAEPEPVEEGMESEIAPEKFVRSGKRFTDNCGEYEFGVLFAALQNPAVSNVTRAAVEDIMDAAMPPLPEKWADGHFIVYYTKNDADANHNITLAQAKTVAANLNSYWDNYVKNFKKPKNVDNKIEVRIYDLGDGLYGYTGSGHNCIYLNSKQVVKNACNRRTTPAHELFHRVQYSYGYVSGTAGVKWMTEGTASYIQKFTNSSIMDYMKRMNEGLGVPWKPLMERDDYGYTTCHFWVYLAERSSWAAIRDVWATYLTNGKNAKAAVETVTNAKLSMDFDKFFRNWIKTNYMKDLGNAPAQFDYNEDESGKDPNLCGVTYGPLRKSPRVASVKFTSTSPEWKRTENFEAYSADYYDFNLTTTDKKLNSLQITVDGAGQLTTFINMKGGVSKKITNGTAAKEVYVATFKPGDLDRIGVIVGGGSAAGSYTISVVPCETLNISGTWDDSYGYVYDLSLSGSTVTGTVDTDCGVWDISGTYVKSPSKLNFTATNNTGNTGCAEWFKYNTTIATCNSFEGTWTNSAGFSGSFTMWKRDASPSCAEPSFIQSGVGGLPSPTQAK